MIQKIEFDSTVCGGFPVSVVAWIAPAEPDVGIMFPFLDDYELFTTRGKPLGPWLKVSKEDIERLQEEALYELGR